MSNEQDIARLQSDVEHLSKDKDALWDALQIPIRNIEETRHDLGKAEVKIETQGREIGELKTKTDKINETLTNWTQDIAYIREQKDKKNKISVNVISSWIIAISSFMLWLYAMFGSKVKTP